MLFRNMLLKYYAPAGDTGEPGAPAGDPPPVTEPPEGGQQGEPGKPDPNPNPPNPAEVEPPPSPQKFPEDWRDQLAGDDAKYRKQLERYASPNALAKAHRELQAKVSSGELKNNKLPDAPTAEELAAWRKDNNVPDKASDYINDLPSGVVLGEGDKARVDSFLEAMHGRNVSKDVVQAAIEWNQQQVETEMQDRYNRNADLQEQTESDLRSEWGPEYKRNINLVGGLISQLPESAREAFGAATAPDGTAIFNNADVVRWLVDMARQVNPVGTVVPGATNISAIDDELTKIETVMRNDRATYNKDSKMQARYLQLLEAKERISA